MELESEYYSPVSRAWDFRDLGLHRNVDKVSHLPAVRTALLPSPDLQDRLGRPVSDGPHV